MGPVNRACWRVFGNGALEVWHPHTRLLTLSMRLRFYTSWPMFLHLMKNLKAALIKGHNIILSDDTVKKHGLHSKIMNLKPVDDLVEFQQGKDLLAPKLTKATLEPSHFQKMKVSGAMNLFSNSVSSALQFMISQLSLDGQMKANYETASWFIAQCNRWFDLMSSRSPVMALSKAKMDQYTAARSFLQDFVSMIDKCNIREKGAWKPVQTGIVVSTNAVLDLAEELLKEKQSFLLTSRFSQDCFESLFSCVRFKSPVPSPREFKMALKIISIAQFLKDVKDSSYQCNDNQYLADPLNENSLADQNDAPVEVLICDIQHDLEISTDQLAALYYVAGYCLYVLKNEKRDCEAFFQ